MLNPLAIPGLVVTGTDTGVGKTLVAGAIAQWLRADGRAVAVCKPAATGCVRRREGLVSEDAEFLAAAADSAHPLDLVCPCRYLEPLAPAIAAQRAGEPLDWEAIARSIRLMSRGSQIMVVEGVGGAMVPMDDQFLFIDVMQWLGVPVVVVARPSLGTINHTLLTVEALRRRNIRVAGVVINRYPPDQTPAAEETSPRAIEKWGKVPILCVVPEDKVRRRRGAMVPPIPAAVAAAVAQVDWWELAQPA